MPPMGKGGKAGRNPLALLRGGRSVDDLFLELDGDGSGSIDRDELRVLLQQLGRPAGAAELDRIMAAVDVDGSGSVELAEFKAWWSTETGEVQDVEWTTDPVTGEEGFFDGNGVWVTAGWTDEGGAHAATHAIAAMTVPLTQLVAFRAVECCAYHGVLAPVRACRCRVLDRASGRGQQAGEVVRQRAV